jgi:hypothetical protein
MAVAGLTQPGLLLGRKCGKIGEKTLFSGLASPLADKGTQNACKAAYRQQPATTGRTTARTDWGQPV